MILIRKFVFNIRGKSWRYFMRSALFINEKKKRINLGMHNDSRLLSLNKRKPVWREIEIGETEKDYKMRIGAPCLWSNYYSYGNKSLDGGKEKRSKTVKFLVRCFVLVFLLNYLSSTKVQCDKKRLNAVKWEAMRYVVTSRATLAKIGNGDYSVRCRWTLIFSRSTTVKDKAKGEKRPSTHPAQLSHVRRPPLYGGNGFFESQQRETL